MQRKIIITEDGSTTIHILEWDEQYHSKHGAIQESQHVFIKQGLHHLLSIKGMNPISILEIGFGTGLNAFMTLLEAEQKNLKIFYQGVEAYPVSQEEISQLNYSQELDAKNHEKHFLDLHDVSWEEKHQISSCFQLEKKQKLFSEIDAHEAFDLIYFDAFGARVQPELWTEDIFAKMYAALNEEGSLVTYSAKGSVRRAMQAVGFTVERLEGPPGKREMLRALKRKS